MDTPERSHWDLPGDWDEFEQSLLDELATLEATQREVKEVIQHSKGYTFVCWNVKKYAKRELQEIRKRIAHQKFVFYFNNPEGQCRIPCACCCHRNRRSR